jgi:DNA invertase Pin-like site-specific DNA recombinase
MVSKRVIAYCRVSSEQQATDDKTSHEYQEERIRKACAERGYTVVQVLKEVDERWETDRPELNKAVHAIKHGEADVLMAMILERLTVDTRHMYMILDDVEKAGGRLEFADQVFEDTPEGRFLRDVYRFMGELEVFRIGARSRQGHKGAAYAGLPVGRRPLGYRIEGKKTARHLELEDAEVSLVRRIFKEVADGVPVRRIAWTLEEEGHKTSFGNTTWWAATIRSIVHNKIYKGIWRGQKTETHLEKVKGKMKSVTRKRLEEEQGPIFPCPRIVSDELWEQANARLELNADESARNNKHPESHLVRSPFGFCGECGYALHCTPAERGRKARYTCGNKAKGACSRPSIRQDELDAVVWERVDMLVNNPGAALKKLVDQAYDGTLDSRIAELEKSVTSLATQSANRSKGIARAWGNGDESLAISMENELKPITKALAGAEAELAALQEQARRQAEIEDLPSQLEKWLNEGNEQFDTMTWTQKRSLMGKLNLRVLLYDGKPDSGLKPVWTSSDTPKKPANVEDRVKIMMARLPEHLFGLNEEDDFWDFEPDYLIETAVGILQPVELSDAAKQKIAEAQARLTPEQRKANEDFLKLTPEERKTAKLKLTPEQLEAYEEFRKLTPEERWEARFAEDNPGVGFSPRG